MMQAISANQKDKLYYLFGYLNFDEIPNNSLY